MAALQAELKIVGAGAGGIPGTGGSNPTFSKEIADSLKDMARFFRRPEQVLGGGLGGLKGVGGAAALSVSALGLAIFKPEVVQEIDETISEGLKNIITSTANAYMEQLRKDIAKHDAEQLGDVPSPVGAVGKDLRNFNTNILPIESFSLLQKTQSAQEELNQLLNDNIDDRKQLNDFERIASELLEQRKFASEEIKQAQMAGLDVQKEQFDIIDASSSLLSLIKDTVDDVTLTTEKQMIAEAGVNTELLKQIELLKEIDRIKSKGKSVSRIARSPLTGRTVSISGSRFGLEGAGSNRDLLERFGSPEAITATGR